MSAQTERAWVRGRIRRLRNDIASWADALEYLREAVANDAEELAEARRRFNRLDRASRDVNAAIDASLAALGEARRIYRAERRKPPAHPRLLSEIVEELHDRISPPDDVDGAVFAEALDRCSDCLIEMYEYREGRREMSSLRHRLSVYRPELRRLIAEQREKWPEDADDDEGDEG